MDPLNTFKKWTLTKPYFFVFLILGTLVFFIVFNLGFDSYKRVRGLASEPETQLEKGLNKVVVGGMSDLLSSKNAVHSKRASAQDQFLYGYLKGRYEAVVTNSRLTSIRLKESSEPLKFSENRKQELARNFQALFFTHQTAFENLKSDRLPASEKLSFSLVEEEKTKGELSFIFSKDQELEEIQIIRLSGPQDMTL